MITNELTYTSLDERMENGLVIRRTFNAPRELLWQVWSDPEHLKYWWGPKGFLMTIASQDFRTQGVFHYSLHTPGGKVLWGRFVYHEIDTPERMTFTSSFSDENGTPVRNPMSATWPLEIMNTLTFSENDDKTMLTITGMPYSASENERRTFAEAHDAVRKGFGGTFDRLDAYLEKLMIRQYMAV